MDGADDIHESIVDNDLIVVLLYFVDHLVEVIVDNNISGLAHEPWVDAFRILSRLFSPELGHFVPGRGGLAPPGPPPGPPPLGLPVLGRPPPRLPPRASYQLPERFGEPSSSFRERSPGAT